MRGLEFNFQVEQSVIGFFYKILSSTSELEFVPPITWDLISKFDVLLQVNALVSQLKRYDLICVNIILISATKQHYGVPVFMPV